MGKLTYIVGDALKPKGDENKIIAHVVNNKKGWGRGFVKAVSRSWAEPERQYRNWDPNSFKLGNIQLVQVEPRTYVANLLAQDGYKTNSNPQPLSYQAFAECLQKLLEVAKEKKANIHAPRLGAGLAGGNWMVIETQLKLTLCSNGIDVTIYDLPTDK